MRIRKFLTIVALTLGLATNSAEAQLDIFPADVGSDEVDEQDLKPTPFFFNTFVDGVGKAKINNTYFKGDKFQFAIANAELGLVCYYNPCYTEGITTSIAYTETYYGWRENPWFDQEHFQTTSLTFSGFSKRLDRWFWRGMVQFNIDGWNWDGDYAFYNFMMWGRYTLCQDWGIHVGFFAETGMRIDRVYPVIGFDWQISEKWKLNAVFPFDMSLQYAWTKHWTVSLAGRTFDSRHRVNKKNANRQYLARYTNGGIEMMIKYEKNGLTANVHAGSTLGGVYRLSNHDNRDPHHYKLDAAGYAGAEIDVRF